MSFVGGELGNPDPVELPAQHQDRPPVYVTLLAALHPQLELICETTASISEICVLSLHYSGFGRVHTRARRRLLDLSRLSLGAG